MYYNPNAPFNVRWMLTPAFSRDGSPSNSLNFDGNSTGNMIHESTLHRKYGSYLTWRLLVRVRQYHD